MKRRRPFGTILLLGLLVPFASGDGKADSPPAAQLEAFEQEFRVAMFRGDGPAMDALVAEYESVVFSVVMHCVHGGIGEKVGGWAGASYFEIASAMAGAYAKRTKKPALAELVGTYAAYNRETALEKARGERLLIELNALAKDGRWQDVLKQSEEVCGIFERIGDVWMRSEAMAYIGLAQKSLGRGEEAVEANKRAFMIKRELGDNRGEITVAYNLGLALNGLERHKEAIDYDRQALAVAQRSKNLEMQLAILKAIGKGQAELSESREAIASYMAALDIARAVENRPEEFTLQILIGDAYLYQGACPDAIAHYTEALELSRQIKHTAQESLALRRLAVTHDRMGENEKALSSCEMALEAATRSGNMDTKALALDGLAKAYEKAGRLSDAKSQLLRALDLYVKRGDNKREAETLCDLGRLERSLGEPQEAAATLEKALDIARQQENRPLEEKALVRLGYVYYDLRQFGRANEYLVSALEGDAGLGIELLAEVDELTGLIGEATGNMEAALKYSNDALNDYEVLGDRGGSSRLLINIGAILLKKGESDRALEHFRNALETARSSGDARMESSALSNSGYALYSAGRYADGLEYLDQALAKAKMIDNPGAVASALVQIGQVYEMIGQFPKALEYYEQTLAMARKAGDRGLEVSTLLSIGTVYFFTGNSQKAVQVISEALEKNPLDDISTLARGATLVGQVMSYSGLHDQALENFQFALKTYRTLKDTLQETVVLINLGFTLLEKKKYDEAMALLEEALVKARSLDSQEDILWAELGLGKAKRGLGKKEEALGHYQRSIQAIEAIYLFMKGFGEEERSAMIGGKAHVYRECIELLLELHQEDRTKGYDRMAFRISEKAKSRTFQELLARSGARTLFLGDERFRGLLERERALIAQIGSLNTMLAKESSLDSDTTSGTMISSIREEIKKSTKDLKDIEGQIESGYPRYADLKRPKDLDVEEVRGFLGPDEAVLSYTVLASRCVVFIVSRDNFYLVEREIGGKDLAVLVHDFLKGLRDVQDLNDLERFKPEAAFALYSRIFAPVVENLKNITKLYVSPDGVLYTVPFEAFVDRPVDEQAFRRSRKEGRGGTKPVLGEYAALHYLIDTYTITYLPSVGVLRSLKEFGKPGYGSWKKGLVAFADPVFNEAEQATDPEQQVRSRGISKESAFAKETLLRSTGREDLARLKESADETAAIARETAGQKEDIYLRERASEVHVQSADLREARFVLFATHGLLGGDFRGIAEPSLALTLIGNPPGVDGFLSMSEVLGLDLNAELVILSACNTSGKSDKAGSGEGFAGLTRSFMYAGAKTVLVTHWSVETEAARDLMVNTVRNMKTAPKSEALRQAKLTMRSSLRQAGNEKISLSHPFFWAPFVSVGEGK